jgi:hypothetical protein
MRSLSAIALFIGALAVCAAPGCLARFGYGSIERAPDDKSIQQLMSDWQSYHVSYSGLRPGRPSGLMFDPRHDERELQGKRWEPIRDREVMEEVAMWLQRTDTYPPRLFRLMGPEGVLYGYVYTGWDQVVARAIDNQTMYVTDIPLYLTRDPFLRDER